MTFMRPTLLVAAPLLADPNFQRAVVLITTHNEQGAMGLVLNRPSEVLVRDALPDLIGVCDATEPIYVGGPVERQAVLVLARFENPSAAAGIVVGDVGFAAEGTHADDIATDEHPARAFVGYAGWGPGQLELEIEREDWILQQVAGDEIFTPEPELLWGRVLERKGGEYALLARMPLDPSLN